MINIYLQISVGNSSSKDFSDFKIYDSYCLNENKSFWKDIDIKEYDEFSVDGGTETISFFLNDYLNDTEINFAQLTLESNIKSTPLLICQFKKIKLTNKGYKWIVI